MANHDHDASLGSESSENSSRVDKLAEEYLGRLRKGESPSISEYADAHPDLAEEIRDVLRTLAVLEDCAPEDELRVPRSLPQHPDASGTEQDIRMMQREAHHPGITPAYFCDELAGQALDAVSTSLVHGLTGRDVSRSLRFR